MDKSILRNQRVLNINRLPGRCSLIPAQRTGIDFAHKEESAFITSLNGNYRFKYFTDDVFEDYFALDVDDSEWDILPVPAVWEYNGYGLPCYPNVEYPFPFDPPYIDIANPIGCYRRDFYLDKIPERSIIRFDGVDNCFELYINGRFAGFSKNCRMQTEFDITALLVPGKNLLALKVYKYSDGSYLENQDMLLASGITRDIYLINTKKEAVWDYALAISAEALKCTVYLEKGGDYSSCRVKATLNGTEQSSQINDFKAEFVFPRGDMLLWNAETPNLYDFDIVLERNGEIIENHFKRVGFREAHRDGVFACVNGSPIHFKGINRHEYNCKTGRYITVEQIRSELETVKRNNINAIRCAHYPNHPAFYDICAELGIYLMDEADCESHGCGVTGDQGFLSKRPDWFDAYFDRVSRMVARDSNEIAVVIWSNGNEVGSGENVDKCGEYLRALNDNRMVRTSGRENNFKCDFVQNGYCTMESLMNTINNREEGRPVLLTEYAHAMGNGPGTLKDYWDAIYHHDNAAGGFGWEFKNHGYYKENEGVGDYLYGGDFGDINSWSNFTLDGFCFSNGTEKPGMLELREAYAPAWVSLTGGEVMIMNTNDFLNLSGWTLEYTIREDTEAVFSGTRTVNAAPHETVRFDDWKAYKLTNPAAKYYLDLVFTGKNGAVDAHKQLLLRDYIKKAEFKPEKSNYAITQNGGVIELYDGFHRLKFDGGMLSYFAHGNDVLIKEKAKINLFRAPTDNDGIVNLYPRHIREWEVVLLDDFRFHPEETTAEKDADCVTVVSKGKILPHGKFAGFTAELTHRIYAGGILVTSIEAAPYGEMPPMLPRFGFVYTLNKCFENCAWYGHGKGENYIDRCLSAPVGYYGSNIADMNVFYEVPQENGNRYGVGFASVSDNAGKGFTVIGSDEFEFSYHDFTLENLTKARHRSELKKSPANYLYVDYKMRGVGSRSCGPDPEPQYDFFPHSLRFVHALAPTTDKSAALKLLRTELPAKTAKLTEKYQKPELEEIRQMFECKE